MREGLSHDEPILVVLADQKVKALRASLGVDAADVVFVDMDVVGRNPALIIPEWKRFVQAHGASVSVRGIGEPISARRDPTELAECERHEALLNARL